MWLVVATLNPHLLVEESPLDRVLSCHEHSLARSQAFLLSIPDDLDHAVHLVFRKQQSLLQELHPELHLLLSQRMTLST